MVLRPDERVAAAALALARNYHLDIGEATKQVVQRDRALGEAWLAPPGTPKVDPDSAELDRRVRRHMEAHPSLSYSQAFDIVTRHPQCKALVKQYAERQFAAPE